MSDIAMTAHGAARLMQILDEASAFRNGWQAKAISLISSIRFADASMFQVLPAEAVPRLLKPESAKEGSWASGPVRDIARGLDYGYTLNKMWFDRVLGGETYQKRGISALCEAAVETQPASPLSLLFGLDPAIRNLTVTDIGHVAALARIAAGSVNPALLAGYRGNVDLAVVPPFDEIGGYASARLRERFPKYEAMFSMLDCSDEEKYLLFLALTRAELCDKFEFTALCVAAGQKNLPLHRVLWAYAKTSDSEVALAAWDMPDEYLMATFVPKAPDANG